MSRSIEMRLINLVKILYVTFIKDLKKKREEKKITSALLYRHTCKIDKRIRNEGI